MTTIMKWSSGLLLTSLLCSGILSAQETIEERKQRAKQVEMFYSMAEQAYENGEVAAAREALRSALSLNRQHAHSIALARRMQTGGNQTVLAKRKRIFNNVIVPIVDFDGMSFKDSINALSEMVEKQSKGKVIPNFIINDRAKVLKDVEVTLKLKNVPAGDVLEHLLRSAGASASFGKYTTTIRPRIGRESSAPKVEKKEEVKEEKSEESSTSL